MLPLEVYQAGLCTAIPTVFDVCENDRLSRNGTCYEDSCCTSVEAATSWHYRLAQLSHVIFSCFGICLVLLYILRYSSKHMLPDNIRVFVNIMLLIIVTHSVDMILFHVYHLVQSFRIPTDDPCFVRENVSFCSPFRYTYSLCTMGLCICQYCMYIDRLTCAFYKNYMKHQKPILAIQLVQLIVLSVSIVMWVYRKQDPNSYTLSCLNVPPQSTGDMALATVIIFPINIICFFLSIGLFRVFKRKEKGSSSRFEINRHFTAAVDVESSEFLYRTTGTQAILLICSSIISLSMRIFYYSWPRPFAITTGILSYIFSIYSMIVPWVMVRYAESTSVNRKSRISSQVGLKSIGVEGADHYFGMMKMQWE